MILETSVVLLLGAQSAVAYLKDRSLLSPLFITPTLWFVLVSLYFIIPHDLNRLGHQFLIAVSLWSTAFFAGALLIGSTKLELFHFEHNTASKVYRTVLFYISCALSPVVFYELYKAAANGPSPFFFVNLRGVNMGLDEEFSLGLLSYVFNIAFVSLLIELMEADLRRIFNPRVVTLLLINIVQALLTVGRLFFLNLFVSAIVVLILRGKIKGKHLLIFVVVVLACFLLLTIIRSSDESADLFGLLGETLKIYIFSSLPAFDCLDPQPTGYFGPNVFRFGYAVMSTFGADITVNKIIYDYVEIPYLTNIYSIMYIFFVDFGYKGVAIAGLLYGILHQGLYKLSIGGNHPAIIFFAILVPSLIMQFTGEFLLSNFSNTLQYLIIIIIPYAFFKNK